MYALPSVPRWNVIDSGLLCAILTMEIFEIFPYDFISEFIFTDAHIYYNTM